MKNQNSFQISEIARAAAGGSNLDLRTLNELSQIAEEYGLAKTGGGRGWIWTVTAFEDNSFEVLGVYTEDGLKTQTKKRRKPKERATKRETMNDHDIERSLRRTRKKVRELAINLQPDKMLTLTTRKAIVEAEVFKKIASRFFALCRKSDMNFEYVAVFERHTSKRTSAEKFGSLHLHVATKGFLHYNQLRHFWRKAVQSVTKDGDYEGANMNASERNFRGGHYSPRSIAMYISKYMTKDMDDEHFQPNKRRFWSSRNIRKPVKLRFFSPPASHQETFRKMFSDIVGQEIKKVFMPDTSKGQPPIIWLSTG